MKLINYVMSFNYLKIIYLLQNKLILILIHLIINKYILFFK